MAVGAVASTWARRRRGWLAVAPILTCLLLALSCAAPRPSTTGTDAPLARPERVPAAQGSGTASYTETERAGRADDGQDRVLIVGIAAEVRAFSTLNGEQNKYVEDFVHGNLFIQEEGGRWIPAIAAEAPSLENGTWQLYPNGGSETLYRIKRGVKWHDGVEFTVHDLVFSWRVGQDRDLPFQNRDRWEAIRGMEPLDDYTLRVIWKGVDTNADAPDLRSLWPMPRHILETTYNRDKQELLAHPFWSTEFVGLGPYKLVRLEAGSHLQLTANDDYILGKPRIRNVVVRFYQDSSVLIAALLAGDVHITLHGTRKEGGLTMGDGIVLATRWRANGEGRVLLNPYRISILAVQLNRDFQQPGALGDIRARQGLLFGTDRQTLVEQLYGGLTDVADAWIAPQDPDYPSFAEAVTRYDFDAVRAQRLLADVGWQRGADGALTNAQGERFRLEYRAQGREEEAVATAVADNWKRLGIETQLLMIPAARARDHEWMSKFPGILAHNMTAQPSGGALNRYTCTQVPGPENNWLYHDNNPAGYCSEEMERYWTQAQAAFPFAAVMDPFKEMMRVGLRDLPYLPLFFEAEAVAVRSDVVGINRVPPKTRGRIGMHAYTWSLQ